MYCLNSKQIAAVYSSAALFMLMCYQMFTQGSATLPLNGMGAVTQQLADDLPEGVLKLNSK